MFGLGVMLAPLRAWRGPVIIGWAALGVVTCLPFGERHPVQSGCRFRRPEPDQRAVVEALVAPVVTSYGARDVRVFVVDTDAVRLRRESAQHRGHPRSTGRVPVR